MRSPPTLLTVSHQNWNRRLCIVASSVTNNPRILLIAWEGGSGQILFVLRWNFLNPSIRLCNILISPHPLVKFLSPPPPPHQFFFPPPPPPPCADPSPLSLKTMWTNENHMDWTKTVTKSLTKCDVVNCNNKQFSFMERMTEKDVIILWLTSFLYLLYCLLCICFLDSTALCETLFTRFKNIYISLSHIFRMSC